MIKDKSVVLGVCGGIAAYKVVEVASRLKKLDAIVDVIMTENATEFVTPLTFRSITHRPVVTDMFAEPKVMATAVVKNRTKLNTIIITHLAFLFSPMTPQEQSLVPPFQSHIMQ